MGCQNYAPGVTSFLPSIIAKAFHSSLYFFISLYTTKLSLGPFRMFSVFGIKRHILCEQCLIKMRSITSRLCYFFLRPTMHFSYYYIHIRIDQPWTHSTFLHHPSGKPKAATHTTNHPDTHSASLV